MLGTESRNAQTYLAGALLSNGARLAEIHRDHVILERNGERAALYLAGVGASPGASNSALLTVGGEPGIAPKTIRFSADELSAYIRTVPAYRDDAVIGFRVFPGNTSGPFSRWGLRSGDVILSLDGSALVDADQATELLNTLTEGASLTAQVMRGAERVTVALDGADLVRLKEASAAPTLAHQPPP